MLMSTVATGGSLCLSLSLCLSVSLAHSVYRSASLCNVSLPVCLCLSLPLPTCASLSLSVSLNLPLSLSIPISSICQNFTITRRRLQMRSTCIGVKTEVKQGYLTFHVASLSPDICLFCLRFRFSLINWACFCCGYFFLNYNHAG